MCFDSSIKIDYDVERAKQLIKESKYPDGHTGATIIVPAGRQIGIDNATFVQGMWKEIGINVEVQQLDPAIVGDRFDVEDHEVISGFQWTNQMVDPSQQVVFFTIDPALNSGYKSAEMQDLVDRANIELDPVKRCELYYEVQRLFNKDQVSIPLFYTVNRIILNPAVIDYQPSSMQWHQFKYTWLNR